jgi:hypothetical protein
MLAAATCCRRVEGVQHVTLASVRGAMMRCGGGEGVRVEIHDALTYSCRAISSATSACDAGKKKEEG